MMEIRFYEIANGGRITPIAKLEDLREEMQLPVKGEEVILDGIVYKVENRTFAPFEATVYIQLVPYLTSSASMAYLKELSRP